MAAADGHTPGATTKPDVKPAFASSRAPARQLHEFIKDPHLLQPASAGIRSSLMRPPYSAVNKKGAVGLRPDPYTRRSRPGPNKRRKVDQSHQRALQAQIGAGSAAMPDVREDGVDDRVLGGLIRLTTGYDGACAVDREETECREKAIHLVGID